MGIALEKSDSESVVALEGNIDIACASELKAHLLRALSSGTAVRISLDAATYLDVTALQLLWAAGLEAQRAGIQFQVSGNVPQAVSSMVADAGFSSFWAASPHAR